MAVLLWRSTCLLLLLALSFHVDIGFAQFVSDPTSYKLLSGPLIVGWSLKPGFRVSTEKLEIYKTSDDRTPVTAVPLPLNASSGRATFDCGLLHDAGEYFVQLSDGRRSSLARSKAFAASWPELRLILPAEHMVQSLTAALARIEASDVNLSGSSGSLLCQPLLTSGGRSDTDRGVPSSFEIQLWRLPAAGASVAEIGKWLLNNRPANLVLLPDEDGRGAARPAEQAAVQIYRSAVVLSDVVRRAAAVPLPCELLDTAGYYQLLLAVKGTAIVTSNVMTVTFADSYRLSANRSTVFPCFGGFQVYYTRASCSKIDVIRLYALRPSSVTGSADLLYLYERRSSSDFAQAVGTAGGSSGSSTPPSVVSFDCNDIIVYHMENSATEIYCVKHLAMSANGSMLVELSALCLPINSSVTAPVDGQWSDWSDWTPCTSSCPPGQQSRHRFCNRPLPSAGGRMCPGNSVQWRACGQPCSPAAAVASLSTTVEPRRQGPTASASAGNRIYALGDSGSAHMRSGLDMNAAKSDCRCGCKLSEPAGTIVIDDIQPCLASTDDASSAVHLSWLVHNLTREYARITVAIVAHKLSLICSLRVRDGPLQSDRLLAASAGMEPPGNVTSSGPTVQIELSIATAALGDKPSQLQQLDLAGCAFAATYVSRDAEEDRGVSQLRPSEPSTVSISSSHLIVIIGCTSGAALTVVLITAAILLRKRCLRSSAYSSEHTDVKDGVAVIEGDESNISHLHRQVHNGQYIHFKHDLPSELVTPCEEEAPSKIEAAARRRGKGIGGRLDGGSSGSPQNRRASPAIGYSLPRSSTLPNPRLGQELLAKPDGLSVPSSHHQSVSMLPDPYHVRPEDFVHTVDLLHSSRHRKSARPAAEAAAPRAPHQGVPDSGRRKHHSERRNDDGHRKHAGHVKRKPDGSSGRDRTQQAHSKRGKRKQLRQSSRGKVRASAGAPEEETLLALSGASSSSPAAPVPAAAVVTPRTNRSSSARRPEQLLQRAAGSSVDPDASNAPAHAESESLLHSLPPPILESSS